MAGAVSLVAEFSGAPWSEESVIADLKVWWSRDRSTPTAVEWIVSAAHADQVRRSLD